MQEQFNVLGNMLLFSCRDFDVKIFWMHDKYEATASKSPLLAIYIAGLSR